MYKLIRPLIFKASSDPETMHRAMMRLLRVVGGLAPAAWVERAIFDFQDEHLRQKVFGLDFRNPAGLAGGFDKQGEAIKGFINLGFGFVEVGTVTRHAQPGQPRPRIFRLTDDEAMINRMGFNNSGADAMAARLGGDALYQSIAPIGINLGKSKITELADAAGDYLYSFQKLYNHGDYFVVNISSPNTPGLRQLQDKSYLLDLLGALNNYRGQQVTRKPILVKVVVDFTLEAVDEILQICRDCQINGVICSNTSLSREGLSRDPNQVGGLSGRPNRQKSTDYIRHIRRQAPSLPIIGVGGIFSAADAYEKIKVGASLIQVYTGLVYEGPGIVKKINQGLAQLLQRDGFKNISEAVGVDRR